MEDLGVFNPPFKVSHPYLLEMGWIYNHPIGKDYKWYISGFFLPIGGLYGTDPTY